MEWTGSHDAKIQGEVFHEVEEQATEVNMEVILEGGSKELYSLILPQAGKWRRQGTELWGRVHL